jgi:hypothetical protein
MSLNIDEFEQYLKIDKYGLDDDLRRQPSLLFEVTAAYELALARRDKLKDYLALCEAHLDAAFRRNLSNHTEAQIKQLIIADKARRVGLENYHKAKEHAGQLSALKDAFVARGYMLRDMCTLYTANYFQTNSSRPTPDTDAVVYEARKAKMNEARQRS